MIRNGNKLVIERPIELLSHNNHHNVYYNYYNYNYNYNNKHNYHEIFHRLDRDNNICHYCVTLRKATGFEITLYYHASRTTC
jgi:hypothetical protein